MLVRNRQLWFFIVSMTMMGFNSALGQVSAFMRIDTLRISEPLGARDRTLSTEQQFVFQADFEFQNAEEMQAKVSLPSGFKLVGSDSIQGLAGAGQTATATWVIQAPTVPGSGFIKVEANGRHALVPLSNVTAVPDSMEVNAVQKAELEFTAEITAPPSALDRRLNIGQRFTIAANLQNLGAAQVVGSDSVSIFLPEGYETIEPLVKELAAHPSASATWEVRAPEQPTGVLDIAVNLLRRSQDENTNASPVANTSRVDISVTTDFIGLTTALLSAESQTVVVRGRSDASLMAIQFQNGSDSDIQIESINLHVQTPAGEGLSPTDILAALRVVDHVNVSSVHARLSPAPSGNPIQVRFSPALVVAAERTVSIAFLGELLAEPTESAFRLAILSPQSDITARDDSGKEVDIEDALGRDIDAPLIAGPFTLVEPTLKTSFFNYPNPLIISETTHTNFFYYLERNSDVRLSIYTLLGDLVWSRNFVASDRQGNAGDHDKEIFWDGTNDKGQEVLSGVYIAVLSTNQGKATTKVAVAK